MTVQEFTPEELATEEWCDVVGYEGVYSVSDLGRVRRHNSHPRSRNRYHFMRYGPRVDLCRNGLTPVRSWVRDLVAQTFLGTAPNGHIAQAKNPKVSGFRLSDIHYAPSKERFDSLVGEEWREIPSYEGVYSASSFGRVRRDGAGWGSCKAGKILRPTPIKKGYLRIGLSYKGNREMWLVSHLVALAFVGPQPTPLHQTNHKDGVKTNNRSDNLEWLTNQENQDHANHVLNAIVPTRKRGVSHHNSHFTESDIRDIRGSYAVGVSMGQIARDKRSTVQTISRIIKRKVWAHVE